MAELREGIYGYYSGSPYTKSESLTKDEMRLNATYIYKSLGIYGGWTMNAICSILGNMQAESTINPGRWQSDKVGSTSNGYGLVQWTPSTKYTGWCSSNGFSDPSEMDANLSRIVYEVENGLQWIPTDSYPLTFEEFTKSHESIEYLAKAFLLCYERPADKSASVQNYRSQLAYAWHTYFETGSLPDLPDTPTVTRKKRKYNFLILNANKRRRAWIR